MYEHVIFNISLSELSIAEESSAPADLSKKIIFRKTKVAETNSDTHATDKNLLPVVKKAKKEKQKVVLSFDANDDDEDNVGQH